LFPQNINGFPSFFQLHWVVASQQSPTPFLNSLKRYPQSRLWHSHITESKMLPTFTSFWQKEI
jgi:hypothetical protein